MFLRTFTVLLMLAVVDSRLPDAARVQDSKTVRALIEDKVDVNARSSDGSTALLWSAHWNDVTTAELLLRAGADTNAVNDFGTSPISEACLNGSTAMVRLLLQNHANPNLAIATGETPCAIALNGATNTLYVVNHTGDSLTVVNLAKLAVITNVKVGRRPQGIAIDAI